MKIHGMNRREWLWIILRDILWMDKLCLICFSFLTGSNVMTCELISVTFSMLEGTGRRPIIRTCGPIIELSSTYQWVIFRTCWRIHGVKFRVCSICLSNSSSVISVKLFSTPNTILRFYNVLWEIPRHVTILLPFIPVSRSCSIISFVIMYAGPPSVLAENANQWRVLVWKNAGCK